MDYLKSGTYSRDVETAVRHVPDFQVFFGKKVLVLGASGLIGSFIVDCFRFANAKLDAEVTVFAAGRDRKRLEARFGEEDARLRFIEADVMEAAGKDIAEMSLDYMVHAAGYGHPKAFRETPAEVLLSHVAGTGHVLEIAKANSGCRVLYVSSGEVQEQVDHLSARACYPIGKKAAETLCVSYVQEYGIHVVIARPCHTFGANMAEQDNRAASQFLTLAANGRDIEMYSAGTQMRSFAYISDCASGILTALARGAAGGVYGIASDDSCTVREFAEKCAAAGDCKVHMHIPTEEERAEVSPIARQLVENAALKALGWCPAFSIEEGIDRSVKTIQEMEGE